MGFGLSLFFVFADEKQEQKQRQAGICLPHPSPKNVGKDGAPPVVGFVEKSNSRGTTQRSMRAE
jgi:hypothetical protein